MLNIWFTSDHHFGHSNIIEFEKYYRPFTSVEEMNETIITRWNNVVRANDTVYHLGDFCFGRKNVALAGRLNGKKRLVMGNHDSYPSAEYLLYFDKLYGAKYLDGCILTHMPVHPDSLGGRWLLNVHGHLHSNVVQNTIAIRDKIYKSSLPDLNYFNVAVEQNNLTPIHYDVIKQRLEFLRCL